MKRLSSILTISLFLLVGCQTNNQTVPAENQHVVKTSRFLMDTIVTITVNDSSLTRQAITDAINNAFSVMDSVEKIASAHVKESELSTQLNKGIGTRTISPELYFLITRSLDIHRQTAGAFDPTIGFVKGIWDFTSEHPVPPTPSDISHHLKYVNSDNIVTGPGTTILIKDSIKIDLGGIAKGYAIDKAVTALEQSGITAGIVEAGGDLKIFGEHPERKIWGIGIKHPRKPGNLFAVLRTPATSIATSGDYERYFIHDGKRYHHLLDPQTGYPAQSAVSVTISCSDALAADAYATAVFILGPEKGLAFIESTPGLEGLILFQGERGIEHVISTGLIALTEFAN